MDNQTSTEEIPGLTPVLLILQSIKAVGASQVVAAVGETKSIIGVRYKVSGSEILPELSKELDKIKS